MQSGNRLLMFGVVAVSLALGLWAGLLVQKPESRPELQTGTVYPEPRSLEPFELIDGNGAPYTLENWNGEWRLVFFGFTHCPDVCPNTLSMLKTVTDTLGKQAPSVTFVSVDPERDQPEQMKRYVEYFDPQFEAATGEHEQLQTLTRRLGIVYTIEEHERDDMAYGVDHSAAILAIDPQARLHAVFTAPHDPAAIAADMQRLMDSDT